MRRGDAPALFGPIRTLFEVGTLGGMTDGQLLDRFRAGGDSAAGPAFAALVERHGPMVLGVCRRVLEDDHLAEDAFQATFLVLVRRGRSLRAGDALGGWLHRVAQRVALRAKVRSDRWRRRERAELKEVAVEAPDRAERDESRAIIDAEVDRLGAAFRLPVVLCDLEGLTQEEAARQLRCPVGTVKSRLARGRSRLRDRLARRGLVAPAVPPALAKLPPMLVDRTAQEALQFVAGRSVAAAVASSVANSLAHKELFAMTFARWTIPGAFATVVILAASGAVLLGKGPDPLPPLAPPAPRTLAVTPGPAPAPPALTLAATGRVVDPNGQPVAGATVLVREWSTWRTIGMTPEQYAALNRGELIADILAEGRTDADGRFRFADIAAPVFPGERGQWVGKTEFPYDVSSATTGRPTTRPPWWPPSPTGCPFGSSATAAASG